tara:strand:- start:15 stop:422 length:408 start_codon:yes stop_codon:yes gene_type:complete
MKITKARLREIILEELQKESESGSLEEFATGRGYDPGPRRTPAKREKCYDEQGMQIPCGEEESAEDIEEAYAGARPGPSHRERTKKYGVAAKAEKSRAAERDREYEEEEKKKKEDEKKITKESLKSLIRKELLNL